MHQGRSAKDHEAPHGFVPSGSRQSSGTRRPPRRPLRSVRIMSIPSTPLAPTVSRLRLCSFVIGSVFIGISTSIEARQWLFCLGLSSRLSLERVWGTQGLLYIPPRVALDKTSSTSSGRKFRKSPISFDFFKKDISFWSEQYEGKLDSWDALVGGNDQ